MGFVKSLFGGGSMPAAPPPPPPPASPPTLADASVANSGAQARAMAAAASGAGFDNTVLTSPQGAAQPAVANKPLLGQ